VQSAEEFAALVSNFVVLMAKVCLHLILTVRSGPTKLSSASPCFLAEQLNLSLA
jgi:hypothetical protein